DHHVVAVLPVHERDLGDTCDPVWQAAEVGRVYGEIVIAALANVGDHEGAAVTQSADGAAYDLVGGGQPGQVPEDRVDDDRVERSVTEAAEVRGIAKQKRHAALTGELRPQLIDRDRREVGRDVTPASGPKFTQERARAAADFQ